MRVGSRTGQAGETWLTSYRDWELVEGYAAAADQTPSHRLEERLIYFNFLDQSHVNAQLEVFEKRTQGFAIN